jgi:hypothetical protein
MSKTLCIVFSLVLSISAICLAVNPPAQDISKQSDAAVIKVNPASKARIQFSSDTWEFGSIPKGAIVIHAFKVKNVGTDSLMITGVKPTCGCTTAPLSDSSIAPGGEAAIMATFNTKNFNGRVNKQIYVDSSDPIKPYLKVSFSAIINNPLLTIMPSPAEADFGNIAIGKPAQLKIVITNGDNKIADLAIIEESAPTLVKATLAKTSIPPKGTAELVLDLMPQAKAGELANSITLEAGNITGSRFTIPWKAVIVQ